MSAAHPTPSHLLVAQRLQHVSVTRGGMVLTVPPVFSVKLVRICQGQRVWTAQQTPSHLYLAPQLQTVFAKPGRAVAMAARVFHVNLIRTSQIQETHCV